MTRKHSRPPMELDLDAFLQSHDTTGSDDDDQQHRSTVDELLIDSDDSSPSSSPRSYFVSNDVSSTQSNTNPVDVGISDPARLTPSQLVTDRDRQSKFRSISQIHSGDNFSLSRQLPPLFGAVRSNAKPGAALAAAAAASRSIPTPHAAAIKLRREKSSTESLDPKASVGSELSCESGTGSEISHSDAKLVEEDLKLHTLKTAPVESTESFEVSGEVKAEHGCRNGWRITHEYFLREETTTDVTKASEVDSFALEFGDDTCSSAAKPQIGSPLNDEEGMLNKDGNTLVLDDSINEHIEGNHTESAPMSTLSIEEVFPFSHEHVDAKDAVDSISVSSEGTKLNESNVEFGLQEEGDEMARQSDVSVDMDGILHQESEKNDGRTQGRPSSSMKPLEYAEELEKKHAFTGLHWEEGAAAQPMKLDSVHKGSTVLGYFSVSTDNTITRTISSPAFRRDHGTPQSLAVHLNYIAVGMSRGVIVVVPSKYSPHYADNMDAKMLMLGLQGDRSYAPVTSMSFNQQGDLLFAGYADGHYTVWDVQRVSAAKVVTEHKAPVVHMLYLGMDSQVTRQFNIVSGDSKGVVKLIRFSPFSWLNRFSTSKTSTLLDESTSTVVCASPLVSEETSSMMGGDSTLVEEGKGHFQHPGGVRSTS